MVSQQTCNATPASASVREEKPSTAMPMGAIIRTPSRYNEEGTFSTRFRKEPNNSGLLDMRINRAGAG